MTDNANLAARFLAHVEAAPERAALAWSYRGARRTLSYAELERASARAAGALERVGVGAGDHVLVLQPMAAELYAVLIAIFRLGATAVFPDPQSLFKTIARAGELMPPKAVIGPTTAQLLRLALPALRHARGLQTTGAVRLARRFDDAAPWDGLAARGADAPALATFTSGSTGAPKALVRAHKLLGAQQDAVARGLGLAPGQVWLATLPVFALSILAGGGTAVLPSVDVRRPAETEVGPLLQQIRDEAVEGLIASPALGERLACQAREADPLLDGLARVFLGGGPVFPDMAAAWARAAPRAAVNIAYGSSEAEPIAHRIASGDDDDAAWIAANGGGLMVGPPTPETRVRVIKDHWGTPLGPLSKTGFDALAQPDGAAGEIIAAGNHVLKGYLGGVGDATTRIRVESEDDGGAAIWFRTGDAGVRDPDGGLRLLGRCSAKITPPSRSGLYPLQIEAAARAHHPHAVVAAAALPDGRAACAVEALDVPARERLEMALAGIGVDVVVGLRKIPMDRRHGSKVDYPRARAAIEAAARRMR